MAQSQYEKLIELDRRFVSFEFKPEDRSFLDTLSEDLTNSADSIRTLSGYIATALNYLQSVDDRNRLLLRNEIARAFAKKRFSATCRFIVSYILHQLGCALDFDGEMAVAAFHQPNITLSESKEGQIRISGRLRGVFGSARPEIVILPFLKTAQDNAEGIAVEMSGQRLCVPDAPLVFWNMELRDAKLLVRGSIKDHDVHFFDLLSLECASLLGLVNEASESAFDYAIRRRSFDKPIIQHQLVANRAANCIIRLTSHDLALQQILCSQVQNGTSSVAGQFASFVESLQSMSHSTLRDTMQTFGAAGIVEDHRHIRDTYEQARLFSMQLCEITKGFT